MQSTYTNWYERGGECFRYLATRFNIDTAKAILKSKPRESKAISVEEWAQLLSGEEIVTERDKDGNPCAWEARWGIAVNREKSEAEPSTLDLGVPVIAIQFDSGCVLVIDGWHRIARAQHLGVKTLPAVLLDKEESSRVRE
jgi:hypothetical protein